jgi:hypothetical protein
MRARKLARRDQGKIVDQLAARCGERLRQISPAPVDAREAEAHAIRILLRRVGTRTTLARIRARGRE